MNFLVKNVVLTGIMCFVLSTSLSAQVGIGAGGGIYYPGFIASDLYNSRFIAGAGYEIFARHTLLSLSTDLNLNAKYAYHFYFSDTDLPFTQQTRFTFNFLTVAVSVPIYTRNSWSFEGGAGLGLLTAHASKDLLSVTESALIPQIQLGLGKKIGESFNLYADVIFQTGSFPVRDDRLSITGFRLLAGFTMFLTETK